MKVMWKVMKNNQPDNIEETQEEMRINKYIAASGYCSRRHADELIAAGKVYIDGVRAELGDKVGPGVSVKIENTYIENPTSVKPVYLAFHKPKGIVCTANPKVKHNIIDYINYPQRIFTIGRLDQDSEGLILLTNDGSIFNQIVRAEYQHEKEYFVRVDKAYDQDFIERMERGVPILDTVTAPCKLIPVRERSFRLILTQGLNRQIRRMCESLGYRVTYLKRIRIMHITLGSLAVGEYRELTAKELRDLRRLLEQNGSPDHSRHLEEIQMTEQSGSTEHS